MYQMVIAHMDFSPQHHVNIAYFETHPKKFEGVVKKIDGMGLRHAMTLQCDWSEAAIR